MNCVLEQIVLKGIIKEFIGRTGPAVKVGKGHTHFLESVTSKNFGHTHCFKLLTLIENPLEA